MNVLPDCQAAYDRGNAANSDPYGHAVFTYMDRWTTAMEREIAQGVSAAPDAFKEMVVRTSLEADTEGLSGFMYGCAVQRIRAWWVHRDAFAAAVRD